MEKILKYLNENKAITTISSIDECFEQFIRFDTSYHYFRGHGNSDYQLVSTLDRFGNDKKGLREKALIQEFKASANTFIKPSEITTTTFEWLALMQHHGIPTRLLDFSRSPFIALFFAVRDYNSDSDAAVWTINPGLLHQASCERLTNEGHKFTFAGSDHWEMEKSVKYDVRLYDLHQPELINEDLFTEIFTSGKYESCFVLEPNKIQHRLHQQQGTFLVSSARGKTTSDVVSELLFELIASKDKYDGKKMGFWDQHLTKVIIPAKLKKSIFTMLTRMNINYSTLFPDIQGYSDHIVENVRSKYFYEK